MIECETCITKINDEIVIIADQSSDDVNILTFTLEKNKLISFKWQRTGLYKHADNKKFIGLTLDKITNTMCICDIDDIIIYEFDYYVNIATLANLINVLLLDTDPIGEQISDTDQIEKIIDNNIKLIEYIHQIEFSADHSMIKRISTICDNMIAILNNTKNVIK